MDSVQNRKAEQDVLAAEAVARAIARRGPLNTSIVVEVCRRGVSYDKRGFEIDKPEANVLKYWVNGHEFTQDWFQAALRLRVVKSVLVERQGRKHYDAKRDSFRDRVETHVDYVAGPAADHYAKRAVTNEG